MSATGPAIGVNGSVLYAVPVALYKGAVKLMTDPDFRFRKKWHDKVKDATRKSAAMSLDLVTYHQYVGESVEERNKVKEWQWHYAIIGYIRDVLKYSENEEVKNQAIQDLSSYIVEEVSWKKTSTETRERLYQVLYELKNTKDLERKIKGEIETLFNALRGPNRAQKLKGRMKDFIRFLELEQQCTTHWNAWECLREVQEAELRPLPPTDSTEPLKIFISAHPSSQEEVKKLKERFTSNQLEILDANPKVGENKAEAIRQKIADSDLMVLFITKNYLKSEDCMCQATMLRSLVLRPFGENVYQQKMYIICDQEIIKLKKNMIKGALYSSECSSKWNDKIAKAIAIMNNPAIEQQVKTRIMGSHLGTLCAYKEEIIPFINDDVFQKQCLTLEGLAAESFQSLEEKFNELIELKKK